MFHSPSDFSSLESLLDKMSETNRVVAQSPYSVISQGYNKNMVMII